MGTCSMVFQFFISICTPPKTRVNASFLQYQGSPKEMLNKMAAPQKLHLPMYRKELTDKYSIKVWNKNNFFGISEQLMSILLKFRGPSHVFSPVPFIGVALSCMCLGKCTQFNTRNSCWWNLAVKTTLKRHRLSHLYRLFMHPAVQDFQSFKQVSSCVSSANQVASFIKAFLGPHSGLVILGRVCLCCRCWKLRFGSKTATNVYVELVHQTATKM